MNYEHLKSIIPKPTREWSQSDVSRWLSFIHLENAIPLFGTRVNNEEKLSIDGSCLKLLNEKDLIE